MAYVITEHCTACGNCLQFCPNDAIAEAYPIFRISPWLCTECVGFAEDSQCSANCPEDAVTCCSSDSASNISGNIFIADKSAF
jgi:ferredoxin